MQSTSCTAVQRNTSNGLKHHKASKTQLCSADRCWQVSFHATYFLNFESGEVPRARCRCQAQNQTLPSALPILPDLPGKNCTLTSTHKMHKCHKTATIINDHSVREVSWIHVAPGCCLAASWIWTGRQSAKGLGTKILKKHIPGTSTVSGVAEIVWNFWTTWCFCSIYMLLLHGSTWLYMALTCFDYLNLRLWYWHVLAQIGSSAAEPLLVVVKMSRSWNGTSMETADQVGDHDKALDYGQPGLGLINNTDEHEEDEEDEEGIVWKCYGNAMEMFPGMSCGCSTLWNWKPLVLIERCLCSLFATCADRRRKEASSHWREWRSSESEDWWQCFWRECNTQDWEVWSL